MRRFLTILVLLSILLTISATSQEAEEILRSYQRNFVIGNLTTKIQVLQKAATVESVEMGALYSQSLNFVIDNIDIFENDSVIRELAILSVRLLGLSNYVDSRAALWELFTIEDHPSVRIEVMNTLGELSPSDPDIAEKLNKWLSAQNSLFNAGRTVDLGVISETVVSLGRIGESTSFPVLFSASIVGYSDDVSRRAREALYEIEGDFRDLILRVLEENSIREKLEAFRIAMSNEGLSDADKGTIAAQSLKKGLYFDAETDVEKDIMRELRYESVEILTEQNWSASTIDMIEHFDILLQEQTLGFAKDPQIIDAITGLGSMGTHEAAGRLALYLNVLSSDVENDKPVSDPVALAVIENLGRLGDKEAFDSLLFVGFLNYSDEVRKAADDALKKL